MAVVDSRGITFVKITLPFKRSCSGACMFAWLLNWNIPSPQNGLKHPFQLLLGCYFSCHDLLIV